MAQYRSFFTGVARLLRPGGRLYSESAGAGNVAAVGALLGDVAAEFSLQPPPPFPDAGVVFEHVESAGFALPLDAAKTVAQRRSFSREELTGFLRSQAAVALIRDAPEHLAEAITDALGDGVDRLRRHDGTYDQTFVRLEILAGRPDG
ncbi:MAG: hypothetical protein WD638_12335 [Nitriliruptoraceae bacterium]